MRKDVVIKNLKLAFPEKSGEEIIRLAEENYVNILKTFFDTFLVNSYSPEDILSFTNFIGFEKLESAYGKGKGVVLLTGHFGNWELGALAIGIKANLPINVLTKQQRNPYVTKWMDTNRAKYGNQVTNLGSAVKNLIRTIYSGGVIGIVGDQRGPKEGMRIKLFNRDTAVHSGFAVIVSKSKAPAFVVLAVRNPDETYTIEFNELNYDENDDTKSLAQKYFDILEGYIKEYPSQWFWMHNIWKY